MIINVPCDANYRVYSYVDVNGVDHFGDWYRSLKNHPASRYVTRRLSMMRNGHLGDSHPLRMGGSSAEPMLTELRMNHRPGYRMYGVPTQEGFVIFNGGTKRTQKSDIEAATRLLKESYVRASDECRRELA